MANQIPKVVPFTSASGEVFDIPLSVVREASQDYIKGFRIGFSRAYSKSFNTGALMTGITIALTAGVTVGTLQFLKWQENRGKASTSTSEDSE